MGEATETMQAVWAAQRMVLREEAAERRSQNLDSFRQAVAMARKHGLVLRRCSDVHYQIGSVDHHWLINLYPGNQRIFHERKRPRGPFLKCPCPWTLRDVVEVAVAAVQTNETHQ